MKLNGKSLTFGPECVPNKTKVGHFLPGIVPGLPSAKHQKISTNFSRDIKIFIQLTVAGNMYGESRNTTFLVNFH